MALSGVVENKVCNGLITFSVEWRAEQDILNGTMTMYYDCYVDTSKCASAYIKGLSNGVSLQALGISYAYGETFTITRIDPVGKRKVSSFVSKPIEVGENDITAYVTCNFIDGGDDKCKAYSNLTTYVNANHLDCKTSEPITVSGLTRTTIGEVYGDHILGNEQTLSLTRKRTEFTHKVEYICGTASGLLLPADSTTENLLFELPVDLAKQNTEKITVDVTFNVTTYYNGQSLGTRTETVTFTMPDSVAPSCSLNVSDAENYADAYGGYVQRQSRLYINVTPTISYDSPIVKYEISANGAIYDIETNTFTTGVLKNSGKQTISVIVTDGRGRTGTANAEIEVIPWAKPDAIKINTFRTDADGNSDSNGEYITAHFDASVSPVNNKNSASYKIRYQKVSGLGQGEDPLDEYRNVYSITDGTYTFKADKDSTYEITLIVTDDFDEDSVSRGGSNAVILMHFGSDGESMAVGGLATLRGVLDVFFKLYPRGGFVHPKLTSINETTPNTYYCDSPQDLELPSRLAADVNDPFIFEVIPISDDGENVMQRITTCPSDVNEKPLVLVRSLQGENWKPWFDVVSGKDYA